MRLFIVFLAVYGALFLAMFVYDLAVKIGRLEARLEYKELCIQQYEREGP